MKNSFLSIALGISLFTASFAQGVTIGNNNPPDPSATLDVQSTNGGLLFPRLTNAQRNAISNPANGLTIYNTTTNCLQTRFPSGWQDVRCDCQSSPSSAFTYPNSVSVNSPATFTASTSGLTYSWTFQGGSPATSTSQTQAVTWASAGTYTITLTVTDNNGCSTSTSHTINVVNCSSGSVTFNYTGNVQTWVVPSCVTSIVVDVKGAQGGGGAGGLGGRAQATIPVTPGETLNIYVGGNPQVQSGVNSGGWNGGGNVLALPCGGGSDGWPGGGASDIRRGNVLANRLVVGGGGGGQGWSTGLGGAGGGLTGGNGAASWIAGTHGQGGTQSAGGTGGYYSGNNQSAPSGALGVGGDSGPQSGYCIGGAGGGGYYGGGGGYVSAGGGGSSYVAYPGNTNTSTTSGFQTGHGQIIIAY